MAAALQALTQLHQVLCGKQQQKGALRFLLESAATEPQASENLSGAFLFVQNCYNTSE